MTILSRSLILFSMLGVVLFSGCRSKDHPELYRPSDDLKVWRTVEMDTAEVMSRPRVVLETTAGNITLELFPEAAPISVENFLSYVEEGFYEGTIFHRVISGFMIQGGGFTVDMEQKPTRPTIRNEAGNGLENNRGTLAMARTSDVDSASSQFYINLANNPPLDGDGVNDGYAVFGRVYEGMGVVDQIGIVETGEVGRLSDVPLEPIIIKRAVRTR